MRDYFDDDAYRMRLISDLGSDQHPDPKTVDLLRTRFDFDASAIATTSSPVYRYFAAGSVWLVFCLFSLAPFSMMTIVVCRRCPTKEGLLLGTLGLGLVVGEILCSHIISFRYLHPFPVIEILCLSVILNALTAPRRVSSHAKGISPEYVPIS
jgi:hypothetical protein